MFLCIGYYVIYKLIKHVRKESKQVGTFLSSITGPEIIKKFSTSLFIFSGPFAYNFLQQNFGLSLPSICTIQSHVYSQYSTINEGQFRFDGLLEHIKRYELSGIVSIGEDANRVISRVEYDSQTDCCVGFVLPISNKVYLLWMHT